MRNVLIVVFLVITISLSGNTYYVATNGNDGNSGTISQPFATWQKAFSTVSAGDVVYIRGGVYYPSGTYNTGTYYGVRVNGKNGTSSNTIQIMAYPGEVPILDCSDITQSGDHVGLTLEYCSYWYFKGLWIRNAKEYSGKGASVQTLFNCTNIVMEQCTYSDSGNGTVSYYGDNIKYINCDSYNHQDYINNGNLANGFGGNVSPGAHVTMTGCRSWHNSDDGFDFYKSDGYIVWTNCWAFNNGYGDEGNGAGFKTGAAFGSQESGVQRALYNCLAFNNQGIGFDESQDNGTSIAQVVYNCTSYNNGVNGYNFQYGGSATDIIRNDISFMDYYYQGNLGSNIVDHNSWQNGHSVSASDFVSLDDSGVDGPRQSDGSLPSLSFLHLATGSDLIDAGIDVGLPYSGSSPDIGCFESGTTTSVSAPSYVSSVVQNSTPSVIELTFSLSLANVIPSSSAFAVNVNSSSRSINTITISGSKVLLSLSSPVAYGDIVTFSYSKPSSSYIQSTSGGATDNISSKGVTNNVYPASPVYQSSVIENATPSKLDITFNLNLANIIPSVSAFTVKVNSSARSVSSISVSGTKASLTLSSPVANGDLITFAYTRPSSNQLQSTAGGQVATLTDQTVTNNVSAAIPSYVSSVIQNSTPNKLEITFSLSLGNYIPATSSFGVTVNSTSQTINSVAVSGTKVTLTLSAPVTYGQSVTVAYTKPSSSPLQTSSGVQVPSFSAQNVTNYVGPVTPTLVSATVESASPTKLVITYNLSLANTIPAASSFVVTVNSVTRSVSSVAISGTTITLTLSSAVASGNTVVVSYTKPASNPLQTAAGGFAASFAGQAVTNNVQVNNAAPVVVVNYKSEAYSGFVEELNASGSYDSNNDKLTFSWVVPSNISVSSTTGSSIEYLSPVIDAERTVQFVVKVSDGKTVQSKTIPVDILPYEPNLDVAEVTDVKASGFIGTNYPANVIDGNIGTMWAVDGDDQWLLLTLAAPFSVQHVKLAFQPGQKSESVFDILGSDDMVNWEPVLTKSNSCSFSGDLQVFDFPASKASKEFRYIKLIGHCNSTDTWNYISEFRIFGYKHQNPTSYEEQPVKIYPNPAHNFFNIKIEETTLGRNYLRIVSMTGSILFEEKIDPGISEFQVPINLLKGIYLVQIGTRTTTLFSQKLVVSN